MASATAKQQTGATWTARAALGRAVAAKHNPSQINVRASAAARVSRTAYDPETEPVTDSVTIAKTPTTTGSATVAAETTVTTDAMAKTVAPRVTTQPTRRSRLRMPAQRTRALIKAVSSPSARGADADVVVASVTTSGQPMTRWRMRLRSTQTAKQPKRSQNALANHIDDAPLTSVTRKAPKTASDRGIRGSC